MLGKLGLGVLDAAQIPSWNKAVVVTMPWPQCDQFLVTVWA